MQAFEREDGRREYLTTEDLGRCFTAKDKLALWNAEEALIIFEAIGAGFEPRYAGNECLDPEGCMKLLQTWSNIFCSGAVRYITVNQLLAEGEEDLFELERLC